VAGNDLIDIDE